jgi:hypothetical protein
MPPVLGLAGHAAYACRHSGACCTSGWPIPVEADLLPVIRGALAERRVHPTASPALVVPAGLPPGVAAVLGRDRHRCVFHDPAAGCRLHAALGSTGKPASCRQFPWTAVHDPRGTFVSLSHYCPSALARLLEADPIRLVALDRLDLSIEGIDVTAALPPALDATRLMDWNAVTAWTRQALACCARTTGALDLLDELRALERHAIAWNAAAMSLSAWLATFEPPPRVPRSASRVDWSLDGRVRDAVPAGIETTPGSADTLGRRMADGALEALEAALAPHAAIVGRYVAARLVVCWPLHLGRGLPTATRYVEALIVLLAAELAGDGDGDGCVSRARLTAAIRRVDLLVLHHCDPRALAVALDA